MYECGDGKMARRKQKWRVGKEGTLILDQDFHFLKTLQCLDVLTKYAKVKEARHKSSTY